MEKLQIFTCNLPGLGNSGIPIAGSRAGAIGVLDLQYLQDLAVAEKQIQITSLYTKQDFGIRLHGDPESFPQPFLSRMPSPLKWIILTDTNSETLKRQVHFFRERGCMVLVESVSIEDATNAEMAGAQGIIAKGNEAGGRVSEETTFILLQRFLRALRLPVYAHGGIGVHTAAACYASGAAGIVLDCQLALTRESSIPENIKSKIAGFDGTETTCLGEEIGAIYRVCSRLGMPVIKKLLEIQKSITRGDSSEEEKALAWRRAVAAHVGWDSQEDHVFLLGQDISFAASLAERCVTVGGVVECIRKEVEGHLRMAVNTNALAEGSPLALSHGTRYPIVQGPMARVSDTPQFILQVACKGALPFLAAAWLRGQELNAIIQETQALLNPRPWGVGMLGFLPPEVYKEQLSSVIAHHPPFALIAGGQPSQAKALERLGIATYLHVPSPGLFRMFLEDGVKRFVLEGRESGGHVGPLCSFVLWEKMIDVFLQYFSGNNLLPEYHVLFAGGIHDALSASMVAVLSAPLAERGVRVGFQLGSAYLFTEEAVRTGAIVRKYQEEAIGSSGTTVLVTGPGDEERCINTQFAKNFKREKEKLCKEGISSETMKKALQGLKLGKLRIASKGLVRNAACQEDLRAPKLKRLSEREQDEQGLYLVGQLTGLRGEATSIPMLHQDVSAQGAERIEALQKMHGGSHVQDRQPVPSDVAVIGMACLFPGAPDLQKYWENILNKVHAIREIPEDRWNWKFYYQQDKTARDKIYSKWGAFLEDVPFDPAPYGIPPYSLSSIEPLQLLTLEVTKRALKDAGYLKRQFHRDRTSVILGISGTGDLAQLYGFRTSLPTFFRENADRLVSHFENVLPEWTEDSFPGILTNVTAGRIANRFDLGGTNFTVDAACASSLAAVYLAASELEAHKSDMVVVGGADCMQNPFTFMCFAKTQALSAKRQCSPLGESADGITLGEGIGVLVLKRLADAERDGDRIYAIIKGVGAAGDGKGNSLTAPALDGQVTALQRAYNKSCISPSTVGLIEAHATGTVVGDRTEAESLFRVFKEAGARVQSCAVGSVKSMIGHTKSAAGVASLMKAILALHHRVLPPTMGLEKPNSALSRQENPLYVNTETRPWMHNSLENPRRAGVSAFGFGGTNFHAVLEEYSGDYLKDSKRASFHNWPSELFVWTGRSRNDLLENLGELQEALSRGAKPDPASLAYAHARLIRQKTSGSNRLALTIVASSIQDLSEKLQAAKVFLSSSETDLKDPRGIYFTDKPLAAEGKVAFLFPGQGSQYVNMLSDVAIQFPDVRAFFERSDRILHGRFPMPLSSYVFPISAFGEEENLSRRQALAQTQIAQSAMGTADLAMLHLVRSFGIEPDMVAGHSYGEYVALCAAGALGEEDLIRISEARARFILESVNGDSGAMAAVNAPASVVEKMIEGIESLWIANVNAPMQTIISGRRSAIENAVTRFNGKGSQIRLIPVSCAFHSPIVSRACDRLKDFLSNIEFCKPCIPVFSNVNVSPYPEEPQAISAQLVEHLIHRVEYIQEIEAMYREGARIFLEVGPGRVQSGLVDQILHDRAHLSITANQEGRSGLVQLLHLLGQLVVHGVPVHLERIYAGRSLKESDLKSLLTRNEESNHTLTTWMVNGARAIPIGKVAEDKAQKEIMPVQFHISSEAVVQTENTKSKGVTFPQAIQLDKVPDIPAAPKETRNPGHGLRTSPPILGDESEQVMVRHQRLMQHFLETQRHVMLRYLQGNGKDVYAAQVQEKIQSLPQDSLESQASVKVPEEPLPCTREDSKGKASGGEKGQLPEAGPSQEGLNGPWNREWLASKLQEIVSDRTGYPKNMLDLDLDLEAELGIDSIKKVEILGFFLRSVFGTEEQRAPEELEDLTRVKTLGKIVDRLEAYRTASKENEPKISGGSSTIQKPEKSCDWKETQVVPRFIVSAVDLPLTKSIGHVQNQLVLVTDDERGIAETVKKRLETQGNEVAIIQFGQISEKRGGNSYVLRENSAEAIAHLCDTIRQRQGTVGGLIHLLPMKEGDPFEAMGMEVWRERLQGSVKTLFHLLKFLKNDLERAAGQGGGFVVSAAGMGGSFASDPAFRPGAFFPGQGAIPGMLKTLGMEWPEVRVKAVDLWLDESASDLADHLMAEIAADDGIVEVGYRGSRRMHLGLREMRLPDRAHEGLAIDSSWVILVTGGARGITAEVAIELARRYQPTLVIVGRSPMPSEQESEETSRLTDPKELKAALIRRMEKGRPLAVSDVQAAFRRILQDREIRSNLARMQETGAKIEYCSVDVGKEDEFGGLIDRLHDTYGRLDGVIHGAGIIDDKLFKDKTWESFERVFSTKTESAFILSRKLRPETIKFLVFFSSVAGRWGNVGQIDYTAANDVINKLALYLDNRWPGRVVSINWGPWAGSGMASPEIQRQFAKRGVEVISPLEGPRLFDLEVSSGRKGEVEVVVGQGPWKALASREDLHGDGFPLLHGASLIHRDGYLEVERRLDPERDLYLLDHRLDGKPVLPAAMAVELMGEAAQNGWPEWKLTALQDIKVLKGVVLEEKTRALRISARPVGETPIGTERIEIEVTITEANRPLQHLYRSIAVLESRFSPPCFAVPHLGELEPFRESSRGAYANWLFHGPRFQCIREIEGISKQGMIATLAPSLPQHNLAGEPSSQWLMDPIAFDGGLQLALLWARSYLDITVLPSRFKAVRCFRPFYHSPLVRCCMQVVEQSAGQSVTYSMWFTDPEGSLLGMIERVEATGSKSLNRLVGRGCIDFSEKRGAA